MRCHEECCDKCGYIEDHPHFCVHELAANQNEEITRLYAEIKRLRERNQQDVRDLDGVLEKATQHLYDKWKESELRVEKLVGALQTCIEHLNSGCCEHPLEDWDKCHGRVVDILKRHRSNGMAVCPHVSTTRYVGCGGRFHDICDNCDKSVGKGKPCPMQNTASLQHPCLLEEGHDGKCAFTVHELNMR